jgi:hypothetical protein
MELFYIVELSCFLNQGLGDLSKVNSVIEEGIRIAKYLSLL